MSKFTAELIKEWENLALNGLEAEASHGLVPNAELYSARVAEIQKQSRHVAGNADSFWQDHSSNTARELEQLAACLSPGGTHTGGLIARLVLRDHLLSADPRLLAATVWYNWHGGKVGFQFLPDPAETHVNEYCEDVSNLLDLFDRATEGDASRILTGNDLDFYNSLPDRLTIWRGCCGIPPEVAGAGLCWTTRRDIAVWFAHRLKSDGRDVPVLMKARVRKSEVRLVKASEFEIVTMPTRPRAVRFLKREIGARPVDMEWSP